MRELAGPTKEFSEESKTVYSKDVIAFTITEIATPSLYILVAYDRTAPVNALGIWTIKRSCFAEAEIQISFVTPYARRNGIRTLANKFLFEYFEDLERIVSMAATLDGGEFMTSCGYTWDKVNKWVLRKEDFLAYLKEKGLAT